MNFYKRYPGDYMRDTGALTLAEHGAYSLMLDIYYSTERPLPKGKPLYRLLRCESPADKKAVDSVVKQFWAETEDGLVNDRAGEEIAKAEKIREKNKQNGSKGGRPKEPSDNPVGSVSDSQEKPNGIPSGKQHQTPDTRHQTNSKPLSQDGQIPPTFATGTGGHS